MTESKGAWDTFALFSFGGLASLSESFIVNRTGER